MAGHPADETRFRDTLRGLPPRVWIVSLGILVNRAGNFLPVFIVLYLTGRGYSAGAAGIVLGAAGLGNVLGNGLGGYLADRLGRRWTIVLSAVSTSALTAAVPLAGSLLLILPLVGLIGVASQVYRPAAAALLVDSVHTDQQRLAAFAVFRFAMNIGAAAGGLVGGVLATTSYTWMFLSNAIACLAFGLLTAALLRDVDGRAGAPEETGDAAGTPEPSYRRALSDRRLMRFLLMTLVAEFVYIQSTVGLPLHVTSLGFTPADFGLLIGLNGVLVLIFELPITSMIVKRRREYVLMVGNICTGLGLAVTGLATQLVWLAVTVLVWTLGEMLYSSVANAYLAGLSPANMVGRYQGLYGATFTAATALGPLVGGAIYAYHDWVLWLVVGVAGLWSAYLCLPSRRAGEPAAESPADGAAPLAEDKST